MSFTKLNILLGLLLLPWIGVHAQSDSIPSSIEVVPDGGTVIEGSEADSNLMKTHSPKKAAIYSALLPGLGQAYNHKYWKIPIIYGAAAGLTYLVVFNYDQYEKYRETYVYRRNLTQDSIIVGKDHFPTMSDDGVQSEIERTQKNYELAAVGIALVYVLQIVDATVDAHLKTFDVSDDLSMSVRPTILGTGFNIQTGLSPTFGVNLKIRLK